ncbi:MAG: aminoglycoside phosphotransferase family protein [Specibacter sp.]
MLIEKLHLDEVDIETDAVARMVSEQFPQWSGRPLAPLYPAGTDNVMFNLDGLFALRLPRTPAAARLLEKELTYPPMLAPLLTADIPMTVATGAPTAGYPFTWAVSRWLPGRNPLPGRAPDSVAVQLAGFVRALHSIVPPAPSEALHSYRGGLLAARDLETLTAITRCEDQFDAARLTRAWDIALQAPVGTGPATWIHTDLQPGNLLVDRGMLSGVIDWGGLAVGDPAIDLIVAWNLLDDAGRLAFRRTLGVADGDWERGRGWALSIGLVAYPYYIDSNPTLAAVSKYQIEQVLADLG